MPEFQIHFSPGFCGFEPRFSHMHGKCFCLLGCLPSPVAFSFLSLILVPLGDRSPGLSVLGNPVPVCIHQSVSAALRTAHQQCRNMELSTYQRGRRPKMCACPRNNAKLGPGQTGQLGQLLFLTHALSLSYSRSVYKVPNIPGTGE